VKKLGPASGLEGLRPGGITPLWTAPYALSAERKALGKQIICWLDNFSPFTIDRLPFFRYALCDLTCASGSGLL
jgi:hypothetical protein